MDTLRVACHCPATHLRLSEHVYMSHFAYACKTEGKNGISRLISALCVNCLISIPEYSRLNHLDVHLVWTTSETSQN